MSTRYVYIVYALNSNRNKTIFGVFTSWSKAIKSKGFIESGMFELWPLPQQPTIEREKLE